MEIGIKNILDNPNYIKAITTKLNKNAYYSFIYEVNLFYYKAVKENDNEKLKKLEFLKKEEFAKDLSTRHHEADDFVTYSIAFFADTDIINNTIKVASKDSKNKPAILRGINGMQQSITQLTNSKYGKMVEPYVALINSFEPMVELEFNQKIINGIYENIENKEDAFDYIKELNSKNEIIKSKQQKITIDAVKKEIADYHTIQELRQTGDKTL